MPPIRVLLVDDNPEFLRSASQFLAVQSIFQVVGTATNGVEALEQIPRLMPDLVLMDWAMPGMSGVEATRAIKAQPTAPRVIILTMYDIAPYRAAAQAVGADGFVSKSNWGARLMPLALQLFPEAAESANEGAVSGSAPAARRALEAGR